MLKEWDCQNQHEKSCSRNFSASPVVMARASRYGGNEQISAFMFRRWLLNFIYISWEAGFCLHRYHESSSDVRMSMSNKGMGWTSRETKEEKIQPREGERKLVGEPCCELYASSSKQSRPSCEIPMRKFTSRSSQWTPERKVSNIRETVNPRRKCTHRTDENQMSPNIGAQRRFQTTNTNSVMKEMWKGVCRVGSDTNSAISAVVEGGRNVKSTYGVDAVREKRSGQDERRTMSCRKGPSTPFQLCLRSYLVA